MDFTPGFFCEPAVFGQLDVLCLYCLIFCSLHIFSSIVTLQNTIDEAEEIKQATGNMQRVPL